MVEPDVANDLLLDFGDQGVADHDLQDAFGELKDVGHVAKIDVEPFLSIGGSGPEFAALRGLLSRPADPLLPPRWSSDLGACSPAVAGRRSTVIRPNMVCAASSATLPWLSMGTVCSHGPKTSPLSRRKRWQSEPHSRAEDWSN
jgi:hypothetical protein